MMKKRAPLIGFGILILFLCGCAGMQTKKADEDVFLPFPDAVAAKAAQLEKKVSFGRRFNDGRWSRPFDRRTGLRRKKYRN